MEFTVIILVLIALVVFTIYKGVKMVSQGEKWIIQRLGKYHQTLEPGLNFIIPYVDNVAYKVTTKDIVLDIPSQEVITRDNVVIIANAVAYINIVQPEQAVYGIENYEHGIRNLVQTSLRSIIGEMDLDAALSSRDQIKAQLKHAISDDISDWGITLKLWKSKTSSHQRPCNWRWRSKRRLSVNAVPPSPVPMVKNKPPS